MQEKFQHVPNKPRHMCESERLNGCIYYPRTTSEILQSGFTNESLKVGQMSRVLRCQSSQAVPHLGLQVEEEDDDDLPELVERKAFEGKRWMEPQKALEAVRWLVSWICPRRGQKVEEMNKSIQVIL